MKAIGVNEVINKWMSQIRKICDDKDKIRS